MVLSETIAFSSCPRGHEVLSRDLVLKAHAQPNGILDTHPLEPERQENQPVILRDESGMDSRQTLKLLARFPPVMRRRYRRLLGTGLLEVDLAGLALTGATGAGGGGTASALKMSSITFHSPPRCFFHTVTYLPFSVIGAPAALFTVI
jgi:hypothetical protein